MRWFKGLTGLLSAVLLLTGCAQRQQRYSCVWDGLFDTTITLIGYSTSQRAFDRTAAEVKQAIEQNDQLFDIYNDYQGINNLKTVNDNAGIAPVEVDPAILDLLDFSIEAYYATDGTVNVALGSMLRIWHDYRTEGLAYPEQAALPPDDILLTAAEHTQIEDVVIDREAGTVFLTQTGMSLDVGAVAKGFAAQQAIEVARSSGLSSCLLDMGGNVVAGESPPDKEDWTVGIQQPDPELPGLWGMLSVNGTAVVSSGNYQRYYLVDGELYHHIIDPDTLYPADRFSHVTVIYPDSGYADMLSTALYILPLEKGRALAAQYGAEALWIEPDGKVHMTDDFSQMVKNQT